MHYTCWFNYSDEASTSGVKRTTITTAASNSLSKRSKQDFQMENGYVVVYVDGACENNGRKGAKAGIGVWFGDNHLL